ncbi:TniQ family protein [Streptomyces sp. NBC_01198]|uniref:TniQ family protein n=1 Tax=Streptomyces sp. NBC_01198 TaxID=2903769 RepID=UPI002E0E3016|nr:TniQ family protein [Streptomyces sp. NBC_01198]
MSTRLRMLPVTPPPMHAETIGSYLNRLADANRLPVQFLSILLGHNRHHRRDDNRTNHWTPETLLRLSSLTGRTPAELSHAIPALAVISELADGTLRAVSDQADEILRRPACRRCMARRGVHGLVVRNIPPHEAVCRRHHRWLLGDEQYRLHALPEVRQANRRHRRLTRRTRAPSLTRHYTVARDFLMDCLRTGEPSDLRQCWNNRIDLLGDDPHGDPLRPTPFRIELATYPETIRLTAMIGSPHWSANQDFRQEAARQLGINSYESR